MAKINISVISEDDIDTKIDRYVVFTRKDFEETLSTIGEFEKITAGEYQKYGIDFKTKEVVYLVRTKKLKKYFLIYSSIENELDRPCGADSIKVCPVIGYNHEERVYKYSKRGRINRTQNWRQNLKNRLHIGEE